MKQRKKHMIQKEFINKMYQSMLENPQFAQFVEDNKNLTTEGIIKKYNLCIDNSTLTRFIDAQVITTAMMHMIQRTECVEK